MFTLTPILLHAPFLAYFSSFYEQYSWTVIWAQKKSSLCKQRREVLQTEGISRRNGRGSGWERDWLLIWLPTKKQRWQSQSSLSERGFQKLKRRHRNEAHSVLSTSSAQFRKGSGIVTSEQQGTHSWSPGFRMSLSLNRTRALHRNGSFQGKYKKFSWAQNVMRQWGRRATRDLPHHQLNCSYRDTEQ